MPIVSFKKSCILNRAFHTTFGSQSGFKDYAGALRELLFSFNQRKHPSGAAILIVKMSPELNTGNHCSRF